MGDGGATRAEPGPTDVPSDAALPVAGAGASVDRLRPWMAWLALGAALSVAWRVTHQGLGGIATSEVAAGRGVLLLHTAVIWRRWRELGVAAAVALLGAVGWVGARLSTGYLPGPVDTLGCAGLALLVFLVYMACTRDDEAARLGITSVRLGVVYLLVAPTGLSLAYATAEVLPRAWDATALVIDTAFPLTAFDVGRWLERWPVLYPPASFVYEGIFLLVPALTALRLRLPRPPATDLLIVTVVTSILGQACYFITPIVGPAFAFQVEFPDVLPDIARLARVALPVPPYFLRNGMPSIHTAWALVFLWNTRPFHIAVRAVGVLVVALMLVATLGFGQHYVIDLVAAVPYAVLTQAIGTAVPAVLRRRRAALMGGCAALTLAWVSLPHFGASLAVSWPGLVVAGAVATVVGALAAERWLAASGEFTPGTASTPKTSSPPRT